MKKKREFKYDIRYEPKFYDWGGMGYERQVWRIYNDGTQECEEAIFWDLM